MSTKPKVKVTLAHTSGAITPYKPGIQVDPAAGGIREAIVTCVSGHGDIFNRVELLRADIPGADWTALDQAGAYNELQARLERSALDLLDGHDPQVVVTLDANRALTNARLLTDANAVQAELRDPNKRSLMVPRNLPYQLGGSVEGATAVIYSPVAGGGLRMASIHPTRGEAQVAEANLHAAGESKTATLQVQTPVTQLLAAVAAGEFRPSAPATPTGVPSARRTGQPHPGLMPSPLAAPTPFSA